MTEMIQPRSDISVVTKKALDAAMTGRPAMSIANSAPVRRHRAACAFTNAA
jgi:hypothetical protein